MTGSKTSRKTTKKTTSKRKSSPKQEKAKTKFKKMIALAKKIRKAEPSKKWTSCIKEAAAKMKSTKK